jgi:hypothetical protein
LQMLQLLQLQLREICNNDGLRNSQPIGCEGAAAGRSPFLPIRRYSVAQNGTERVTFCLLLRHNIVEKKINHEDAKKRELNRQGRQERQDHTESVGDSRRGCS